MKMAYFNDKADIVHVEEVLLKNQERTTLKIDNKNYKGVLLNYEDWAFIKVRLDKNSIEFFEDNLSKIQDPMT